MTDRTRLHAVGDDAPRARRTATRRIERKSGHSYLLDGTAVDGVTTVIGNGIPKPALPKWAAREVATFAADRLDLLATLKRDECLDLLVGAPWRDRDRAARRGTEVHALAEKLVRGDEVQVPDELTGHVDAYVQFLDTWNPTPVLVEAVVISRRYRYMGTLDLVADLPDGRRWLLDVKTTRSGVYGETALQLAAYRYAETHLAKDGTETPMPPVDATGVIWVRADGFDLVPVETSPDVFRAFLYAQRVAAFCSKSAALVGAAIRLED